MTTMTSAEHVVAVVDGENGLQFAHCEYLEWCKKMHYSRGWKEVENPVTHKLVEPATLCVAPATLDKLTICTIQTNVNALRVLESKG